jgi:alpha-D-ribose 1-methylphosphonate 5-triphosphate synthase subunit PhnH
MQDQTKQPATTRPPPALDGSVVFRAFLDELGETQASFSRMLKANGDPRPIVTIDRNVRRWATGEVRLPGEVWVIMQLMRREAATAAPSDSV